MASNPHGGAEDREADDRRVPGGGRRRRRRLSRLVYVFVKGGLERGLDGCEESVGKRHCFARSLLRFRNAAAAAVRKQQQPNSGVFQAKRQSKQNIQPEKKESGTCLVRGWQRFSQAAETQTEALWIGWMEQR